MKNSLQMSLSPSWYPPALPVPSLALIHSPLPLLPALLPSSPSPCPLPTDHSLPPTCSSLFPPHCTHPGPRVGSVTSPPHSQHQEMGWPGPSSQVAWGPVASVGGHAGPVGLPEHLCRVRAVSWEEQRLGAQRCLRACGQREDEPNPVLPPTAPPGVTQKHAPKPAIARDLGWGWRDEQEINRILFS